jgi:hypothetical protein
MPAFPNQVTLGRTGLSVCENEGIRRLASHLYAKAFRKA